MATAYAVRRVWSHSTGKGYRSGTDYTDNGDGTVSVLGGSDLANDRAGGDTTHLDRTARSDVSPTAVLQCTLDAAYSGLRLLGSAGASWASGTDILAHIESIHINEHIDGNQTNGNLDCFASDAGAQSVGKGAYLALRIGTKTLAGTALAQKEWRLKVAARDWEQAGDGVRFYRYIVGDLSEDLKAADVTAVPRGAKSSTTVIPGDTGGGPPQTIQGGAKLYMLSDLIKAVLPAYATSTLNAPDLIIEQLPAQGNGLDLLNAALKSSAYFMHWDLLNLVIEQHEPTTHNISVALTDGQVYEAKTELGQEVIAIDSVTIQRPTGNQFKQTGAPKIDKTLPPATVGGSSPIPGKARTAKVMSANGSQADIVLYQVQENWTPPQQYTDYEPGPIMYGFSNARYNKAGYLGSQIFALLVTCPDQTLVQPPIRFTGEPIDGEYYFLITPNYTKVQSSDLDFVDGYIFSRSGYFDDTGAVNRNDIRVSGATVYLTGQDTGIVLGPATTNADGYFQLPTGGNRDKWIISAYIADDTYLANKLDTFTTGHPYDDDPNNDGLGPDNRQPRGDQWQINPTYVSFKVVYRPGGSLLAHAPNAPNGSLPESYIGAGSFTWGDAAAVHPVTINAGTLGIDPANVTTDVQAGLLSEKIIDRSKESQAVVVISKPYGGVQTEAGKIVRLDLTTDAGLHTEARIATREIQLNGAEVLEVLTSAPDKFVNELDRAFAKKISTEVRLLQLSDLTQALAAQVTWQGGQAADTAQSKT